MPKVGILGRGTGTGLYSNMPSDELFRRVGHNTGNMAFSYALARHLEEEIVFVPRNPDPGQLDDVRVVVMPLANAMGPHTDLGAFADALIAMDRPVVAVGLGAQAADMDTDVELKPGTLDWLRVIDSLRPGPASNIYTRGPYTARQLARIGVHGAAIGGCPSHFINPAPDLGRRIHRHWTSFDLPRAISVAGGHQAWRRCSPVEQQLVSMMMDPACPGQYVVQSMADMIRISRGDFDAIEPRVLARINEHLLPHYDLEAFKAWCLTHARSFYDIPAWMDALRRHDLTIGPRYHGTALAMQAERMGMTITIDSRTEELCIQTGMPFRRIDEMADMTVTRRTLREMIRFDPVAYDAHRAERARNYVGFLESNGLRPAAFLREIAAAA